jgi:hypothetical protein
MVPPKRTEIEKAFDRLSDASKDKKKAVFLYFQRDTGSPNVPHLRAKSFTGLCGVRKSG